MKRGSGNRPSWRTADSPIARPELWGLALVIVGMLLVEVWQSSRMAELGLGLDQKRSTLTQERSRLQFLQARVGQELTRTQEEPIAHRLGLAPMAANQQIDLPADYLVAETSARSSPGTTRMAWLDRVARTLIPDATARSRSGS